jgi:hypothetical protein
MRFGSKGLDAPTIIGIIVAVIIAIVIIYILWTRGLLPFAPAADRSLCLSELLDACAGTKGLNQVNKACAGFSDIASKPVEGGSFKEPQACYTCMMSNNLDGDSCNTGQANFQTCCNYIRGLPS